MSVYKEGFKAIELIERSSVQIFEDASDFGAPVRKGDMLWNMMAGAVESYLVPGTRKVSRYATGRTVTAAIKIVDEWAVSDEIKTIEQATEYWMITFTSCESGKCKGYDGYISVAKIDNGKWKN